MIDCDWLSERGGGPEGNDDAVLVDPTLGLLAVADGMGGRPDGGSASQLAIRVFRESVESLAMDRRFELVALTQAVCHANTAVRSLSDDEFNGPGTTLSAVVCDGATGAFVHVGDSRVYRYRAGRLQRLTEDHTLVAELVQRHCLPPEKAITYPLRHILSRAVGLEHEIDVDAGAIVLDSGDWLVLTTDGLTNTLSDEQLEQLIQSNANTSASVLVRHIMQAALTAHPRDNLSLVAARAVA
jgi:protein phosphatase